MSASTRSSVGRSTRVLAASKKIPLADRPGPLKREDVQCPICWSILMEPVTLPCSHALCFTCFNKHTTETSLQCPCCRMRLSVWSRKAFRENNLVDKKLWDRIKREFPKLVQTRVMGEDSQDLQPEDLVSVFDKVVPIPGEKVDEFLVPVSRPFRRDGDFHVGKGEIKRELEDMMKQHHEDIENQHRLEEEESQELIKQLKEEPPTPPRRVESSRTDEDQLLAQRILEEEKTTLIKSINARRKLFTERTDSPGTNAKNAKLKSTPSPKISAKRPSMSTLASRSKKQRSSRNRGSQSNPDTNSQNSILNYLSPSSTSSSSTNSQSLVDAFTDSSKPSTSANALKALRKESCSPALSAFSPAQGKGSSPQVIPKPLVYQSVLKQMNRTETVTRDNTSTDVGSDNERDTSTPNSIDLEVNSHFRPICSAPKTPPRRLPDGSFVPLPTAITIPTRKLIPEFLSQLGKEMNSPQMNITEKRVQSVGIAITPLRKLQEREDSPPEFEEDVKSKDIEDLNKTLSETSYAEFSDEEKEASPPVAAGESQNILEQENSQSIEDEIAWLMKEETASIPESQDSDMDFDLIQEQARAFEELREKRLQEEQDRKLAKKLQKEMNKVPVKREEENPFGLRSWLKRSNANASSSRPSTRGSTRSNLNSTTLSIDLVDSD